MNRITALSKGVNSVRRLLAGETVTVTRSWVHLDAVALDHPPDVPPEILVGTTGARGVRVAAEQADGVLFPEGCSPRFIAETARRLHDLCPGRATNPTLATYVWLAAGGRPARRAALQAAFDAWLKLDPYPAPLAALDADVPDESPSRDAPDLAELGIAGGPATQRVIAAGSDRLILTAPADALAQYRWFAEEVRPLAQT